MLRIHQIDLIGNFYHIHFIVVCLWMIASDVVPIKWLTFYQMNFEFVVLILVLYYIEQKSIPSCYVLVLLLCRVAYFKWLLPNRLSSNMFIAQLKRQDLPCWQMCILFSCDTWFTYNHVSFSFQTDNNLNKMDSNRSRLLPMPKHNPFPQRPWMQNNSAAAGAPGATGLKGKTFCCIFIQIC